MSAWHTQHMQKTASETSKPQHLERAAGVAYDARLQPSDTRVPPGLRGVQGGYVVPFFHWTLCTCPWNGKQVSDCQDAQIVRCVSMSASMQAWKTGERLLYARLKVYVIHCVTGERNGYCGKVCGSEARVTEALSGLVKAKTGSKRTQDGTAVLLKLA